MLGHDNNGKCSAPQHRGPPEQPCLPSPCRKACGPLKQTLHIEAHDKDMPHVQGHSGARPTPRQVSALSYILPQSWHQALAWGAGHSAPNTAACPMMSMAHANTSEALHIQSTAGLLANTLRLGMLARAGAGSMRSTAHAHHIRYGAGLWAITPPWHARQAAARPSHRPGRARPRCCRPVSRPSGACTVANPAQRRARPLSLPRPHARFTCQFPIRAAAEVC